MRMTVADIGKVLMSVAKVCVGGNVVFGEEGSYMEEQTSGARARLHSNNGWYVMNLKTEGSS